MKLTANRAWLLSLILIGLLASCKKNEELATEPLSDYVPLIPGKYITYRIDSTLPTDFGVALVVRSYQVRHVIDSAITDNLGRPSYRVYRYLNNVDGTGDWTPDGSYLITRTDTEVELNEDNLRFLKIHGPMHEGFDWPGNTYLPEHPYAGLGFTFSSGDYMRDWNYYFDNFASTEEINGQTYNDVWTVEEENSSSNYPFEIGAAGFYYRSYEKYSKNIGLVFRSTTILEYDPNPSAANATYAGFGVDMWMIDHN